MAVLDTPHPRAAADCAREGSDTGDLTLTIHPALRKYLLFFRLDGHCSPPTFFPDSPKIQGIPHPPPLSFPQRDRRGIRAMR